MPSSLDSAFVDRVQGLEHDVRDLSKKVSALESDVRNVGRGVDDVSEQIKSLTNKLGENSKTNWGVLGAWASVILTVSGTFGYMLIDPIRAQLQTTINKLEHHINNPMHNVAKSEIDSIRRELSIELKHIAKDEVDQYSKIKDLSLWQQEHDKRVVGINMYQSAKIEFLEKEIDRVKVEQLRRSSKVYNSVQKGEN